VSRKIRNVCLAGRPEEIGKARIKPAAQSAAQLPELTRPQHSSVAVACERGTGPAENNGKLADLVWKHFADEITQALTEVQQALGTSTERL
jgi:hypothetical protein